MTKVHVEFLAKALHETRPGPENRDRQGQWLDDVAAIIIVCEHFNPRFDRDKFRKAVHGT